MIDNALLARIEVLQELEIGVANRNESNAEAANGDWRTRMVHDAVFVGREALDRNHDLHVRLLALDRATKPMRPRGDTFLVISAGNAQVVEALDQRRLRAFDGNALSEPGFDASCLLRRERDATPAAESRFWFACGGYARFFRDGKTI